MCRKVDCACDELGLLLQDSEILLEWLRREDNLMNGAVRAVDRLKETIKNIIHEIN
jgi:hypothetical protein